MYMACTWPRVVHVYGMYRDMYTRTYMSMCMHVRHMYMLMCMLHSALTHGSHHTTPHPHHIHTVHIHTNTSTNTFTTSTRATHSCACPCPCCRACSHMVGTTPHSHRIHTTCHWSIHRFTPQDLHRSTLYTTHHTQLHVQHAESVCRDSTRPSESARGQLGPHASNGVRTSKACIHSKRVQRERCAERCRTDLVRHVYATLYENLPNLATCTGSETMYRGSSCIHPMYRGGYF